MGSSTDSHQFNGKWIGGSLFVALWMRLPFHGTSSYFVLGILVLIWFALIARLIIRLFPKGRFHQVPLALGAWMAGLFFGHVFVGLGYGIHDYWRNIICREFGATAKTVA